MPKNVQKPMDVLDIRRKKLKQLITERGGNAGLFAQQIGYKSGSYISQMVGPTPTREVSEAVARTIESKLGLTDGWLDREDEGPTVGANVPLIADVVRHVLAIKDDLKHQPSAEKVAEVVSLAYDWAALTGKVDPRIVQRLLNLTE